MQTLIMDLNNNKNYLQQIIPANWKGNLQDVITLDAVSGNIPMKKKEVLTVPFGTWVKLCVWKLVRGKKIVAFCKAPGCTMGQKVLIISQK